MKNLDLTGYNNCIDAIAGYARKRRIPPQDVDDILQDVAEKYIKHHNSYNPTRGTMEQYVMVMAKSAIGDYWRAQKSHRDKCVDFGGFIMVFGPPKVEGPEVVVEFYDLLFKTGKECIRCGVLSLPEGFAKHWPKVCRVCVAKNKKDKYGSK